MSHISSELPSSPGTATQGAGSPRPEAEACPAPDASMTGAQQVPQLGRNSRGSARPRASGQRPAWSHQRASVLRPWIFARGRFHCVRETGSLLRRNFWGTRGALSLGKWLGRRDNGAAAEVVAPSLHRQQRAAGEGPAGKHLRVWYGGTSHRQPSWQSAATPPDARRAPASTARRLPCPV